MKSKVLQMLGIEWKYFFPGLDSLFILSVVVGSS